MSTEPQPELALIASMVGRTIVEAVWFDANPGDSWDSHDVAHLRLDDGRIIRFGAYGYDAWGTIVEAIDRFGPP